MNLSDNSSGDEDRAEYEGSIKPYMFEPVESECDSDDTDSDEPAVSVDTSGNRSGRRLKDVSEW